VGPPLSFLDENVEFNGAFTLLFPDTIDLFEPDADLWHVFAFSGTSTAVPYVMAGLGIGRTS